MQAANVLNYNEQHRLNREGESAEVQTNAIFNVFYELSVAILLFVLLLLSQGTQWGKGVHDLVTISILVRVVLLIPVNTLFHFLVKYK